MDPPSPPSLHAVTFPLSAPTAATTRSAPHLRPLRIREIGPLPPFQPDLYQRGWSSTPHPTLPLLATCHNKSVTIFSLATFSAHSSLTGGHSRSVRSATWRPGLPPNKLCLVTASFDSTAGLWRWEQDIPLPDDTGQDNASLETPVNIGPVGHEDAEEGWEFTLVLEGQENEIKSAAFSPSGQYLATCSRDKSVWIWEDVGADQDDDEWETVAVLNEHEGDVKCVAWCPDVPGRHSGSGRHYGLDVLASASYDNTIRIWREDGDGEWVCVAVLEGHASTVWGVQWEADPARKQFPRLLTWSADQTLRIWELQEQQPDEDSTERVAGDAAANLQVFGLRSSLGGMPNTMRRTLHEEWLCTSVLPQAHSRDIYSAAWSASNGLVASSGSDGTIVLYAEDAKGFAPDLPEKTTEEEATAVLDGDILMSNGHSHSNNEDGGSHKHPEAWHVVARVPNAHGPYEINHIMWCRRYDPGCEKIGVEEMLVTTGDDGVVRPWQIFVA